MHSSDLISRFNRLLADLDEERSLEAALELAKAFMQLVTPTAGAIDLDDLAVVPVTGIGNSKMETWFKGHPYLGGHSSAFQLFDDPTKPIEAKFFHLSHRTTKRVVAGAVQLTPNWEDNSLLTQTGEWRVGIDFFLTEDAHALLVILSLEGNLRVVELSERLSTTQADILSKIVGAGDRQSQQDAHTQLWEAFAVSEVNKSFYRGVAEFFEELRLQLIGDGREEEDAKLFASRLVGRLLFVWFLRRKSFIDESAGYFKAEGRSATDYYADVLSGLFFRTLNTPVDDRAKNFVKDLRTPYLNGGLFEIHSNDWGGEKVTFPSGYFVRLYAHFDRFNFTTDESSPDYEQVAIDPEMLGRVFESLLATQRTETGESARKAKGTFYTPREVVAHMCKEALRQYLYKSLGNKTYNAGIDKLLDATDAEVARAHTNFKRDLWGKDNAKTITPKVMAAIDDLTILDPACGSGAFPLGMLQLLARTLERLDPRFDPYKTKLNIVKNSIYGVDIEPMAIEIAKLRTWLTLAVDASGAAGVEPLPNLDFKFVCANSLLSLAETHDGFGALVDVELDDKLAAIRNDYFTTSSTKKKDTLKDRYYKLTSESFAADYDLRTRQLNSFDPFKYSSPAQFFDPKQMFGVDGFEIVVGNPPYIGEKGNKATFDALRGSSLRERFYQGKMDLFYFFMNLGIDVIAEDGVLVFITTNYYPTATGAIKLRADLAARTKVLGLLNFNELKVFESALGQHNLITVLQKSTNNADYTCHEIVATGKGGIVQQQLNELLSAQSELASVVDLHVAALFDGPDHYIRFSTGGELDVILGRVAAAGETLGSIANVNQGVQSGIDYFRERHARKFPQIRQTPGTSVFVFSAGEKAFPHLKPWFKNSDIGRYVATERARLEVLYLGRGSKPVAAETDYLEPFKPILTARREFGLDRAKPLPWYQLHWPREQEIFEGPKIIAPQRSFNNTFAYTTVPWYGSGDIYYVTSRGSSTPDLRFVLGVLNSTLIYAWLYFRGKRKGEMLELYQVPLSEIPIARDAALETKIAELVQETHDLRKKDLSASTSKLEAEIDTLVYGLYGLTGDEIKTVQSFANSKAAIRKMTSAAGDDDDE